MRAVRAAVLAIAAWLAACAAPTPAPRSTPTVNEGTVDAGAGVRLFYREVGRAQRTVVVLHGGPGFSLDYLADDLAPLAQGARVIFYDQRGAGRSTLVDDADGLDARRFVDDLDAVRRHFGLERLTLLGHSWGAGVAALYAIRHPERVERLLLVGPMPLRQAELARTFQRLAAGRSPDARAELLRARDAWLADPGSATACRAFYRRYFEPFFVDPSAMARSRGDFCAGTPEALRNAVAGVQRYTQASLGDWDWRPALRQLAAPTLVLHGLADPIPLETAREWAAALPQARLLIYPGAGHFPYVDMPERFFRDAAAFLGGAWPDGAHVEGAGR